MVNGKDFFDGDTKIATKNIPSNAVDKIQVLRNYSEVSQLKSVTNNSDSFALNIKLKEGKENFWFGNVKAGAGYSADNENLYLAQPKLFYYSPKVTFNFLGDINNMGELVLNRRDLRNYSGGSRLPSISSPTVAKRAICLWPIIGSDCISSALSTPRSMITKRKRITIAPAYTIT